TASIRGERAATLPYTHLSAKAPHPTLQAQILQGTHRPDVQPVNDRRRFAMRNHFLVASALFLALGVAAAQTGTATTPGTTPSGTATTPGTQTSTNPATPGSTGTQTTPGNPNTPATTNPGVSPGTPGITPGTPGITGTPGTTTTPQTTTGTTSTTV